MLSVVMLIVANKLIMLSVVMLSVIMLTVIMLSVVALLSSPPKHDNFIVLRLIGHQLKYFLLVLKA